MVETSSDLFLETEEEVTTEVDDNLNPPYISYVFGYEGTSSCLKGIRIMYVDPNIKTRVVIRYGKVIGIGPANIKVEPLNKFEKPGRLSTIKAKELGLKFTLVKDVLNSKGERINVLMDDKLLITP